MRSDPKNEEFDIYVQKIVTRDFALNTINNRQVNNKQAAYNESEFYEVYFRPIDTETEEFYDKLDFYDRVYITKMNLAYFIVNLGALVTLSPNVGTLSINIELKVLAYVLGDIESANRELSTLGIALVVEITERERIFDIFNLGHLRYLIELGVQLAIDDLTVKDLNRSLHTSLALFDLIKVRSDDVEKILACDCDFFNDQYCNGKRLVIENIESENAFDHFSLIIPFHLFQGYFFHKPYQLKITAKGKQCQR